MEIVPDHIDRDAYAYILRREKVARRKLLDRLIEEMGTGSADWPARDSLKIPLTQLERLGRSTVIFCDAQPQKPESNQRCLPANRL
jgi:hypothetical protein